jgi:hypothetical protein
LLATIRARSIEAEVAEAAIMFGAKEDRKSSSKSGKKKDKVDVDVEAASTRSREVGSLPFALSVGSRCSLRDQKSYLNVRFVNEASPLIDLNRSHIRSVVNS